MLMDPALQRRDWASTLCGTPRGPGGPRHYSLSRLHLVPQAMQSQLQPTHIASVHSTPRCTSYPFAQQDQHRRAACSLPRFRRKDKAHHGPGDSRSPGPAKPRATAARRAAASGLPRAPPKRCRAWPPSRRPSLPRRRGVPPRRRRRRRGRGCGLGAAPPEDASDAAPIARDQPSSVYGAHNDGFRHVADSGTSRVCAAFRGRISAFLRPDLPRFPEVRNSARTPRCCHWFRSNDECRCGCEAGARDSAPGESESAPRAPRSAGPRASRHWRH
jgi:hypothetical protein